jgi:predicted methyltransferase
MKRHILICASLLLGLILSANAAAVGGSAIRSAVKDSDRPMTDRERDPGRKPGLVLAFAGVEPGQTVLDMFAGGGYYTELLARTVGSEGRVIAYNNKAYLDYAKDDIAARYRDNRLPNVERLDQEVADLDLGDDRFDVAMMVLSYHDIYYAPGDGTWPVIDGPKMMREIFEALKPGGALVVVDHAAESGAPAETGNSLHRIDPELAKRQIESVGFVFDEASDVLRNAADDRSKPMYAEGVRGNTDRFVFRFKKPE